MNKSLFKTSIVFTCLWGMIAHAYCFLHDTYSHDSMSTIYAATGEDLWKIKLGRYLVPLVRQITVGRMCLPWLTGIVSLLLIAISVYGICSIFSIDSPVLAALTAGIMVTNITVTATAATFLYELSMDMTALLFAVSAAYIWRFKDKWIIIVSFFVFLTLGLYQSYVSVTVTLMMLASVQDFLRDKEFNEVLFRGLKGIGELILGLLLYSAVLFVVVRVGNIDMNTGTYNGVYNVGSLSVFSIIRRIPGLYYSWLSTYIKNQSVFPWYSIAAVNMILFSLLAFGIAIPVIKKKDLRVTVTTLVLCMLLPLGMNLSYLFSGIWSHELMRYAFCLPIIFSFVLTETDIKLSEKTKNLLKRGIPVLVLVLLIANVRTSNTAYMKKEFEKRATVSVMNRVQSCLDQRDDYIYGETKIVFIGAPRFNMTGFKTLENITGLSINSVFSNDTLVQPAYHPYRAYYEYYMGDSSVLADDETWPRVSEDEIVTNMPVFPEADSIQKYDNNIIIVKLGKV